VCVLINIYYNFNKYSLIPFYKKITYVIIYIKLYILYIININIDIIITVVLSPLFIYSFITFILFYLLDKKKIVKKIARFKSSSPAVRVARDVTLLHN